MIIKKISQDATIYNTKPYLNTGLDPLLELSSNSRILLQFDIDNIDNTHRYLLNLNIGDMKNINDNYQIAIYSITNNWTENIGMYEYTPSIESAVNWVNRTDLESWTNVGGDYDITSEIIFTLTDVITDDNRLEIDISSIVHNMTTNNGILIKFVDETIINDKSLIQLYSKDTHTIYEPIVFDLYYNSNYSSICDSKKIIQDTFTVFQVNSKSNYNKGSVARFRFKARPIYLKHNYSETNDYITNYYLPKTYYSIVDILINKPIIPFYDENILSCDSYGNYFNVVIDNLKLHRYYKIVLKIIQGELIYIVDNDFIFQVV